MDIVLGVSMAPSTVRMVLVEGENADGVTVEEDNFDLASSEAPTVSSADQVIAAILGTREGATAAGHQLTSAGVTWTNPADAAALRDALAARKIENVMLVSAFLAAAALTQTVGNAIGYEHTAMLFVEPDTATLAVVDACDGSVSDVYRRPLRSADVTIELAAMIADLDNLATRPQGLFIVGCGVDVAPIKPALEATTWLPISAPEEPETALARGAALASANAPLFASSTAALAYAQDPGTGRVDPYAVAPGYLEVRTPAVAAEDAAYSAVTDDDGDAETEVFSKAGSLDEIREGRRPMLLIGSVLAVIFVTAALALEVALAIGIRPSAVALLPRPVQNLIVPTEQAPAPPVSTPAPPAMHMSAPAAPAPPAPVHVVAPQLPAAPVPAPPPAAPAPVPAPAAPVPAPILVPIPVRVPVPAPVHAPAPQPPVQLPLPQPPVHVPTPPVHVPTPPVQVPIPPVHVPTPPVQVPTPPVHVPTPPVHVPTPPVQAPNPPIHVPTPPVQAPNPPIHVPTPPVQAPNPPIHVPTPPVQAPNPPIHVPTPPVQAPNPPIHVPTPPVQAPNPPINLGTPPVQVHAPQPPLNFPSPQPPIRLPVPEAPRMPTMPAPQMPAPQMPAMPAPAMPRMPSMPAPAMPQMPSMPAPAMPHFNMPMPAFHF